MLLIVTSGQASTQTREVRPRCAKTKASGQTANVEKKNRVFISTLWASMVLLRRSVSLAAKSGVIVYEYLKTATKEYHDAATHPR
jgi:hypothetical protein